MTRFSIITIILIVFYNHKVVSNESINNKNDGLYELTTIRIENYIIYGPKYDEMLDDEHDYFVSEGTNNIRPYFSLESDFLKGENMTFNAISDVLSTVPITRREFGKQCWKEIGCFHAMTFKDMINGDIVMLPMSPNQIDPAFYLFTHENQNDSIELKYNFNATQLTESAFNRDYRTVLMVHGFMTGIMEWMIDTKNALLSRSNDKYNVILIDWHKGSKMMDYFLAAANTQVVGALIADFIGRICKLYNITNKSFHLIGHSLGAHTMGFAGKRLLNPKVYRITGLDPAGPGFRLNESVIRLDYMDASIVDIIHTDMSNFVATGLGINETIGDIDFYPNGGYNQTGCPASDIILNALEDFLGSKKDMSCSHDHAPLCLQSFDNLSSICLPIGYMCDSYPTFLEGRCANCDSVNKLSKCQLMGLYPDYWHNMVINKTNSFKYKFYLRTGNKEVCVFHYQIAFHISNDSDSSGLFNISLTAEVDQKTETLILSRVLSQVFVGQIHTLLVTFKFMVKNISKISINWTQNTDSTNSEQQLKIEFIEINYLSHISKKIRKDLSNVFCAENNGIIKPNGVELDFMKCSDKLKPQMSALKLNYTQLKPFTANQDISSVDFE